MKAARGRESCRSPDSEISSPALLHSLSLPLLSSSPLSSLLPLPLSLFWLFSLLFPPAAPNSALNRSIYLAICPFPASRPLSFSSPPLLPLSHSNSHFSLAIYVPLLSQSQLPSILNHGPDAVRAGRRQGESIPSSRLLPSPPHTSVFLTQFENFCRLGLPRRRSFVLFAFLVLSLSLSCPSGCIFLRYFPLFSRPSVVPRRGRRSSVRTNCQRRTVDFSRTLLTTWTADVLGGSR